MTDELRKLQAENATLRENIDKLHVELDTIREERGKLLDEITKLKRRLSAQSHTELLQRLEDAEERYEQAHKKIGQLEYQLVLTQQDCQTLHDQLPKEM